MCNTLSLFRLSYFLCIESLDLQVKEVLRSGEVYWEYYYTDLVDVVVCDREESIKELWDREDGERAPVVTSQWVILSHKCGAILPYPKLLPLLVQLRG